MSSFSIAYA